MDRKRNWPAIIIGYAIASLVLCAVTAFIYENAAPVNRPMVVRLAVVFAVSVVLIHARRAARGDPLWDPPSDFEKALAIEPPPIKLHPEFAKLRDEVANGIARRSHFERALRPRLVRLAETRGASAVALDPASSSRRRGPSARELADMIQRIERSS